MFGLGKKKDKKEDKPKSVCEMNQVEYKNYLRKRMYNTKEVIEPEIKEEEN